MLALSTTFCPACARVVSIVDHGIDVGDLAAPHRLAERGW